MHVESLECVDCGKEYPPEEVRYRCSGCGSSLDVSYDYSEISGISWRELKDRDFSHFRYREFLPVVGEKNMLHMGGGGTPVVESRVMGDELGIDLWFKMESLNPTGSFKDRGTSVELGKALDHGEEEVVVASTGNMGASIAAYSARAGIEARIYVPEDTGGPKLEQMSSHGAELREVEGGYSKAAQKAWKDWDERSIYLMGDYPYRGEGEKTVGFEIADQIDADTVVLPVGNGTLIHAVWKAFEELEKVGLNEQLPRMVGVQAEGCNTVVKALEKGYEDVRAIEGAETVAGAIACADPLDGEQAREAIEDSGGFGTAVSDREIMNAKELLAEKEGIYAEEAGAAGLAGILKREDKFDKRETVVCPITGHGLKT
ncbi:MAG: threonine synthase [Candidatus Nanohaloarchaeota archaeon QJJ-7]|nr:threonine synthase [Candidatus Nanohaloarchaeota archaeon QJJ-7]